MIDKLKKKLTKVEAELDKCRTSTLQDGWQTQRYAKKARKWDYYAQEKMKLIEEIETLTVQSRKDCPVKLICHCPQIKNWDGWCCMVKK